MDAQEHDLNKAQRTHQSRRSTSSTACLGGLLLAFALVALPRPAAAQLLGEDLELGVGVIGQVAGNFIDRPNDTTVAPGSTVELVYPGFGGVGGGGGLSAELRFRGFLALQIDLILSSDRGVGYIDLLRVSVGQTSLHVPILAKVIYPGEAVRPSFALGADLVFPQALSISTDPLLPATATTFAIQAGPYAMLMAALGVEFILPFKNVDLRVPVSLRGAINPGTPAAARDRAAYTLDGTQVRSVTFSSEWQYHLSFNVGVSYHL